MDSSWPLHSRTRAAHQPHLTQHAAVAVAPTTIMGLAAGAGYAMDVPEGLSLRAQRFIHHSEARV
jgi:hypothetical protein